MEDKAVQTNMITHQREVGLCLICEEWCKKKLCRHVHDNLPNHLDEIHRVKASVYKIFYKLTKDELSALSLK